MRLSIKGPLRNLVRKILAPFQKYEHRLKKLGQRFVLKTIEMHRPHLFASPVAAGPNPGGESMLSASLLLPLLRASRRAEEYHEPAWHALPVGKYLLTSHPRAGVVYHLPDDLAETAWIVQGDYQPNVTAWLCARLNAGQNVVFCGSGSGYHALTAAMQVGTSGKLLACCETVEQREALELNIKVQGLTSNVQVRQMTRAADLEQWSAGFANAVWLIHAESAWAEACSQVAARSSREVYLVQSDGVVPYASLAEASKSEFTTLRKVA